MTASTSRALLRGKARVVVASANVLGRDDRDSSSDSCDCGANHASCISRKRESECACDVSEEVGTGGRLTTYTPAQEAGRHV